MGIEVLKGRHILLGVSGGIAAYKSCDVVRRLREQEAEVQVIMTRAAQEFVTPMTFQALSGRPVRTELFDPAGEAAMGHIELARWAELLLLAPATADLLARLAHGCADNLITTVHLATAAPVLAAPAMNQAMWRHPATQANVEILQARGIGFVGPDEGGQACGDEGPGRMSEAAQIVASAAERLTNRSSSRALQGTSVLITAGPTYEDLDPVRFVGNRSSGKMGYAVAEAAARAGARVTLISGPTALPVPAGVERIDIRSAQQMQDEVMRRVAETQIFIAAAAVADYRATNVADKKIKKTADHLTLELSRNPDILAQVAARPLAPFCVGFAAETENLEANARQKLVSKGLDLVAANRVGDGHAFDQETNALTVMWSGGQVELPLADKKQIGSRLISLIAERYHDAEGVNAEGNKASAKGQ